MKIIEKINSLSASMFFILVINVFLFIRFFLNQQFPLYAVLINLLSILVLCLWAFSGKEIRKSIKRNYLDILIVFLLFALATGVRLYKIEEVTPGVWGDEIVVGEAAEVLVDKPEFTPYANVAYGRPTPLLYLNGWVLDTFGKTITTNRLVSLLFGSSNIAIFYLFLRFFFKRKIALLTSLAICFTYPHVIVSRFAYDMTAAIFFQLISILFLYLAYKFGRLRYFIGTGLFVGLGLYTYHGFRTVALGIIAISVFLLYKKYEFKEFIKRSTFIFLAISLSSLMLIGFALKNQDLFWGRVQEISVFHKGLPADEVLKELGGNTLRTLGMFLFTGDPNPRQNPSGKTMFDIITVSLMFLGLIRLKGKQKGLFYSSIFLALSSFASDIFSIELFPEFHYYGTGHPNVLRISSIIPIVYFWAGWGIDSVRKYLAIWKPKYTFQIIGVLVLGIIYINWKWYFNQPMSRFNYSINEVPMIKIVNYINEANRKTIYASPSIINDERVRFFTKEDVVFSDFTPDQKDQASVIPVDELTIIDPMESKEFAEMLFEQRDKLSGFRVTPIVNPWGEIETIIVYRAK